MLTSLVGSVAIGAGPGAGAKNVGGAPPSPTASVAATGTLTGSPDQDGIIAGGYTLILTTTNCTWVPTIAADNSFTTGLLAGITSAQVEAAGYDAIKGTYLTFANVVRTSDNIVTITLPAFTAYAVTASETLTVVVPGDNVEYSTSALTAALNPVIANVAETVVLSGTCTSSATESGFVTGGLTTILTLTGDLLVADDGTFAAARAAILSGFSSDSAEGTDFIATVVANENVSSVARTSATVVTITWTADATMDITATETVTHTMPASALLASSGTIVATPTFAITHATVVLTGTTVPSLTQAEGVAGGDTTIITVTGDTLVADDGTFAAARAAVLAGFASDSAEVTDWIAEVAAKEGVGSVVRTDANIITITWSAAAALALTSTEIVTFTMPASVLVASPSAIVATPTFSVTSLSIAIAIQRWDGGSGAITITNGVFFPEGYITTTDVTNKLIQVWINGTEQEVYTVSLDGRWDDGTVKSVLVQFHNTFSGTVTGTIEVGTARNTTDISVQTIDTSPGALIYPTDATYLCDAYPLKQVDEVIPQASWPTGTYWNTLVDKFEETGGQSGTGFEQLWTNYQANGFSSSYGNVAYCLFRGHYGWFCANPLKPEYLYRGLTMASSFFNSIYWPTTQEQRQPALLDLALYYWLTGDPDILDTIRVTANNNYENRTAVNVASMTFDRNHGRIFHNILMSMALGEHFGLSTVTTLDPDSGATWALKSTAYATAAITHQTAAGSLSENLDIYQNTGETGCNNWRDTSLQYNDGAYGGDDYTGEQMWQVIMRTMALKAHNVWVDNSDPTTAAINTHMQDHWDYYGSAGWDATTEGWPLSDKRCRATVAWLVDGVRAGDPNVNGFNLLELAYLYRAYGTASLLTAGDAAVDGMVGVDWTSYGSNFGKVFQNRLYGTLNYIAARQGS